MGFIDKDELMHNFSGIDLYRCVKYGNEDAQQQRMSYDTMMMYEIADIIEDAPECDALSVEKVVRWIYAISNNIALTIRSEDQPHYQKIAHAVRAMLSGRKTYVAQFMDVEYDEFTHSHMVFLDEADAIKYLEKHIAQDSDLIGGQIVQGRLILPGQEDGLAEDYQNLADEG